jgi:small subunit ribosomal protein S7e
MFNKSKILKKKDEKPTDLDEEISKNLSTLEQKGEVSLKGVFINSTESVEYKREDGTMGTYRIIRIPHRSLDRFTKVRSAVIEHCEAVANCPCIFVANRTIVSKRAIHHPSQMRPRSRTLKAVHLAILNDITAPSSVVGRRTRATLDGKLHERVYLDPLDKEMMQDKTAALSHAYQRLTTHKVHFEFPKPNVHQQKVLDQLKEKRRNQNGRQ